MKREWNEHTFRNVMAILRSLDFHEVEGLMRVDQFNGDFRDLQNKLAFVLQMDDRRLKQLWAAIEKRQPQPRLVEAG